MIHKRKVFGGILLASGTAIGAGMLALPLSTANNGFVTSGFAFLMCWFFMTLAALLLLEVNLQFSGDKDLVSMTNLIFGVFGKTIAWILYLLFLYALIVAYLMGSSAWVLKTLQRLHLNVFPNVVVTSLIFVFGLIVSYGTVVVAHINRYLMYGLVLAYVVLIASASPSVEIAKLSVINLTNLPSTFPLIITAFGFAPIIPSLTHYLNRDVLALRYVIVLGSLIPLIIYLLWEWVALGMIPLSGTNSFETLIQHHDDGTGVAVALEKITGNAWITESSRWFTLFAIFTSLLGVSLALFHFLADGLGIRKKTGLRRLLLLGCIYIPPLLVVLFYPSGFSHVLSFTGILAALLFGIVPALMAWRMRYSLAKERYFAHLPKNERGYQVFGGKPLLITVIMFFCYISYLEIANCLICRS
jgi:tyrosine-specific transport protein